MQSAPAHCNLAAANPKKTAKIDNGGTHLPYWIDDDVDDTTHVLAIGALDSPAKNPAHGRTIDNGNGGFRLCRRRFGTIRGRHELRQHQEKNRGQDKADVQSRVHEALLVRTGKGNKERDLIGNGSTLQQQS